MIDLIDIPQINVIKTNITHIQIRNKIMNGQLEFKFKCFRMKNNQLWDVCVYKSNIPEKDNHFMNF